MRRRRLPLALLLANLSGPAPPAALDQDRVIFTPISCSGAGSPSAVDRDG